jgi:hypothetical protein
MSKKRLRILLTLVALFAMSTIALTACGLGAQEETPAPEEPTEEPTEEEAVEELSGAVGVVVPTQEKPR